MSYVDAPKNLHDGGQKLEFTSLIKSGPSKTVSFYAFIKQLSDSYKSDWIRESAYGRMDDIQAFKATKRQISMSWVLVASSKEEAQENLNKIGVLAQMLYPRYDPIGDSGISTISASPLVEVKFGNLISDSSTGGGLVGTLDGVDYAFDVENGSTFFDGTDFFPQIITAQCVLHPLHQHDLANYKSGKNADSFGNQQLNFPYGAGSTPPIATNTPTNTSADAPSPGKGDKTEEKEGQAAPVLGKG